MFDETGCEKCRSDWLYPLRQEERVLESLGKVNYERQARLFRCVSCGAFWEDCNGNYSSGISPEAVARYYLSAE